MTGQHSGKADPADFWASGCPTGKRSYVSKKAAIAARRRRPKEHGGTRVSPYLCALCSGWHLGHLPAAVRRGNATRDDIHRPKPKGTSS